MDNKFQVQKVVRFTGETDVEYASKIEEEAHQKRVSENKIIVQIVKKYYDQQNMTSGSPETPASNTAQCSFPQSKCQNTAIAVGYYAPHREFINLCEQHFYTARKLSRSCIDWTSVKLSNQKQRLCEFGGGCENLAPHSAVSLRTGNKMSLCDRHYIMVVEYPDKWRVTEQVEICINPSDKTAAMTDLTENNDGVEVTC